MAVKGGHNGVVVARSGRFSLVRVRVMRVKRMESERKGKAGLVLNLDARSYICARVPVRHWFDFNDRSKMYG